MPARVQENVVTPVCYLAGVEPPTPAGAGAEVAAGTAARPRQGQPPGGVPRLRFAFVRAPPAQAFACRVGLSAPTKASQSENLSPAQGTASLSLRSALHGDQNPRPSNLAGSGMWVEQPLTRVPPGEAVEVRQR